jgi:hypothetical protein
VNFCHGESQSTLGDPQAETASASVAILITSSIEPREPCAVDVVVCVHRRTR